MGYPVPDPALFAALQQGRPGALDRLLEAWLPVVVAWCGRLGGPQIQREDAAHEACIVVMNRHHKVESPEKFPAWLFSVTRNIIMRHRRRAWLRRWLPGEVPEQADHASVRLVEDADTARWVWDILEDIPADQREALVLCDIEGRTQEEVSDILQIPLGTVKGRLRLGRERFRRLAASRGGVASAAGVGG